MSETKQLAGIFPWPKTSLRCGVYTCNRPASYMLRHSQGLFGDTHYPLCQQCAEDIARNLPEELRKIAWGNRTPGPVSTVELIETLISSPEVQALAKGEKAPKDVGEALARFIDILAESGAEVDMPPEGQPPLTREEIQREIEIVAGVMPQTADKPATMMEAAVIAQDSLRPNPRRRPDFGDVPVLDVSKTKATGLTCPVCGKGGFKSKAALTGHMNARHGGKKR